MLLCHAKCCNTGLYLKSKILRYFEPKLSFVILKGRKCKLNTKIVSKIHHSYNMGLKDHSTIVHLFKFAS